MAYLVLIRHGMSSYNAKGLWTGLDNPDLIENGISEAKTAGDQIKDILFNHAFVSDLIRTKHTLDIIKNELRQKIPTTVSKKLNERNYGDYTAKNKWEIRDEVGEDTFLKIRRSWDYPIPNGESLKDVYNREILYFKENIEPLLKHNENILIVSSGNALRVIVKYLEKIDDKKISELEIGIGEVYVYKLDYDLKILSKEIRNQNKSKGKI